MRDWISLKCCERRKKRIFTWLNKLRLLDTSSVDPFLTSAKGRFRYTIPGTQIGDQFIYSQLTIILNSFMHLELFISLYNFILSQLFINLYSFIHSQLIIFYSFIQKKIYKKILILKLKKWINWHILKGSAVERKNQFKF